MQVSPPTHESILLDRARALAGLSLGELANHLSVPLPRTALHGKGWIGQVLECALGANAGSAPEPDFTYLGIELKTLPVSAGLKPRETTYVCSIPLLEIHKETWFTSRVYKKLARVLWVPIESEVGMPFGQRRIGYPLLWHPNEEQLRILQADWEELTDLICRGSVETITAKQGRVLQVRPKGANSAALCKAINENGELIETLPRGFYLRTSFTSQILQTFYEV